MPLPSQANPALSSALVRVGSADQTIRNGALDEVRAHTENGATVADIRAVVETATSGTLPATKFDWQSPESQLLRTVWGKTTDAHAALVASRFDQLSKPARSSALALLAQTGTRAATEAYVAALRAHGWPDESWPAMTAAYDRDALFPEIVLPALLDGSIRNLPEDVVDSFLLGYAEAGKLPPSTRKSARPRASKRARELVEQLMPMQRSVGLAWRWNDEYVERAIQTGLVLDLLGHLEASPEVVAVLRDGETLRDPRLAFFAVSSLLALGEAPSPESIEWIAADPSSRGLLFRCLEAHDGLDLMPGSQRTQEKLAEADMVTWLTFPAELGRAPDELELMKTIEVDTGNGGGGVFVYYVFRFRTHEPHWSAKDGWMAGVSGPFRKADIPTLVGWGDTFSTFTPWDEFDPSEHLSSIRQLMERWREHHRGR